MCWRCFYCSGKGVRCSQRADNRMMAIATIIQPPSIVSGCSAGLGAADGPACVGHIFQSDFGTHVPAEACDHKPRRLWSSQNNLQGESAFDCVKSGSDALHKYLQSIDLYLSSLSSTCVQESSMLG